MKLAGRRRDKPGNVLVNLDVLLPFLEQSFSCKKCADKGLMSPIVICHKTMFLDTCLSYRCTVCEVCENGASAQTAKVTGEIRKRKGSPIAERKENSDFNSAGPLLRASTNWLLLLRAQRTSTGGLKGKRKK